MEMYDALQYFGRNRKEADWAIIFRVGPTGLFFAEKDDDCGLPCVWEDLCTNARVNDGSESGGGFKVGVFQHQWRDVIGPRGLSVREFADDAADVIRRDMWKWLLRRMIVPDRFGVRVRDRRV